MNSKLLECFNKWAAPYSPFSPIEQEDIWKEMKLNAKITSVTDFTTILMDLPVLKKDENVYDVILEFLNYYVQEHKKDVESNIHYYIENYDLESVIYLVGCTRNNLMYDSLINELDYTTLNKDEKMALLNTFILLNNKKAHEYLEKIEHFEKDNDLLNEINIAKVNLTANKKL